MTLRRPTYLIQDPYDLDAIEFMRTIDNCFGLRPVCIYTRHKARLVGERRFPMLTGDRIEAAFEIDLDDLTPTVDVIRARYDVRAIIPYSEPTIELAAELCDRLDLPWVSADTLRRFRDKASLKSHIAAVDSTVRLPVNRLVTSVDDFTASALPATFVLKPNDGFGNRSVGVFGADELAAARDHIASSDKPWILEEFVGGTEYHLDGQVRTGGEVTTLAIFEYLRSEVNDYRTVYRGEIQVTSDAPIFRRLHEYATRLLKATGLERCPFHLEVKVDELGPAMIDLGARFPSEGGAKTMTRLHPGRPDAYSVAAHDYFAPNSFASEPVDWTFHDTQRVAFAYGISRQSGIIESVDGVEAVEAMPCFVRWHGRPEVGDRLEVTRDLRGAPFIVELNACGDRDSALELIDLVDATVRINQRRRTIVSRTSARIRHLVPRVRRRAAVTWRQLRRR